MTEHMAEATLPILYFEQDETYINQTYGYTSEVDLSCFRNSILPLDGERVLRIALEKYNAEIQSVSYEVRSSDIGEYEEFFPGLDVVDILATDVYSGKYPKSEYEQLKNMAQGKPIAIGECGPLPPVEVLKDQPGWCWFMCWAGFLLEANSPEKIKEVYNYEGVRNLK